MMQTTLFDTLKARVGELWQAAQEHPFVHALGAGTLPKEKLIHYLTQDNAYLTGDSRAIAMATAKAPDTACMAEYAGLLSATLEQEMALHREYCTAFGISTGELDAVEPSPICRAYIDFGIATAAIGDVLELLAALTPCGVGYGETGARLMQHPQLTPTHPYRQWIYTYGGEEYQQYARWMVEALNDLGAGVAAAGDNDPRLERLTELFRLGCRYEWLFWEMAWREDTWPV
jgi:thiaminase/transcriptional activator TenA